MISIEKTNNKGLHIIITGDNGEVLQSSENLKTRQSCFKNILATARNFTKDFGTVIFYDNSTGRKKPIRYMWRLGDNQPEVQQ